MIGFVIGNGKSREGLDLSELFKYGPVFGCNALYRDFQPDLLFSIDKSMQLEIEKNYCGPAYTKWNTKSNKTTIILNPTPQYPYPSYVMSVRLSLSGSHAIYGMVRLFPDIKCIYLIGFDLLNTSKCDYAPNVYENTENYKRLNLSKYLVDSTIRDIRSIFGIFPNLEVYRVGVPELEFRTDPIWKKLVMFIDRDSLIGHLNYVVSSNIRPYSRSTIHTTIHKIA